MGRAALNCDQSILPCPSRILLYYGLAGPLPLCLKLRPHHRLEGLLVHFGINAMLEQRGPAERVISKLLHKSVTHSGTSPYLLQYDSSPMGGDQHLVESPGH